MFKRILIANRGEIACRIIKTARRVGIATVTVGEEPHGELHRAADARSSVVRGEALLARGDYAAAEAYLRGACEAFPDQPGLWELLAEAHWNSGRREAALTAIDRALVLAPSAHLAVHKGWMLCQNGDLTQAETTLIDAIDCFPGCTSAYRNLTQVYKNWERWSAAADAAGRACAEDPTDFDMRESWASSLIAAERPLEAIIVIETGLKLFEAVPACFQMLMLKARAHEQLGDLDRAIDAIAKAVDLVPNDEAALEKLCHLMSNKGHRPGDAQEFLVRLRTIQAQQLPELLPNALAQLWERTGEIELDDDAVEWAWELADKSIWQRDRWQAAAAWGKEASLLLRRWRETLPAPQVKQIDDLVDKPDLTKLSAVSRERRVCFVVGAHVGPWAAAVSLFANSSLRRLKSADRGRVDHDPAIPVTPNSVATVRAIAEATKNGALIGIMADEATYAGTCFRAPFLGRDVALPAPVPRLIQRYNGASFWCCPSWRNGRIAIELEQLPDPAEGEPSDTWSRRWFGAYLGRLEEAMRGHPKNLGLFSGIWENVNRAALRERQRGRPTASP